MNVIEEYFIEIMKMILTMTLTGSTVSVFLFAIKPVIKYRLSKSFQYYMWFPVIVALVAPLSKIDMRSSLISPAASVRSIQDIAQWISDTTFRKSVNSAVLLQAGSSYDIRQDAVQFSGIATVLFIFWLLGVIGVFGFNIVCYALYICKLKKYNMNANQQEIGLLNEISGNKNSLRLYKNSMVAAPVLIGVFHPEIILPYKKYEDRELQGILLHEITHMQRCDIVVKWMLIFAGALHWFNPIVYFIRQEIDRACELACDESVIKKFDNAGKQSYGETLIMAAADTIRKTPVSITMFKDKKNLKERLGAIMKHKDLPKRTIYVSCVLFAVISYGTLCLGTVRSSTTPENRDVTTYAESAPVQRQRYDKENEVKQALCDYDKDNIDRVEVHLEDSGHEIVSANIFVVSKEKITDIDEQEKIKAVASGCLNLDGQNISLEYMDSETFSVLGEKR